jgi:uroporphyrinogen III methyltransferase/synthase
MKKNSSKTKAGVCYLVGAGPGAVGLLTLRGKECIERATVVVYDYLSNPEFLRFAPASAETIYVGKKAGAHTMKQEEINALLVEKTQAGHCVVRLKGGDPFLFGRGGEEAEALAAAGLPFEIVPGVTSAIGGPAFAGIPVTHREHNAALTIFTGHEEPDKTASKIDYAAIARMPGTKVMLMGVERIGVITQRLQEEGMPGETPVALVRWATTGRQETMVGTVASIAAQVAERGFKAPAVAVFGEVVRLRETLAWRERLPLHGCRVAVTRTREQAGKLVAELRDLGADAYELPTIRIAPPEDKRGFYELVADAHAYDWIIFTSPNGVDAFFQAFFELYADARSLGLARIAAIGPATAERVRVYHLAVDLMPEKYVAEEIVAALQKETSLENLRFLLPRAESAREVLPSELSRLGAIVDEAVAYRTVPEMDDVSGGQKRFREEGADWVTFTSSSTAENFFALGLPWPEKCRRLSIGPVTSATLLQLGHPADAEASKHDIPGLIQCLLDQVQRGR